jgi:acetyl-CoA C-acetyltransferase
LTGVRDPRSPVLVGVGTASADAEAVELMTMAAEAALADAGGRGLPGAVDRVIVPQGSWTYPDPGRLVASRIGAKQATTHLVELGIPQQSLINEALAAILSGTSDVAMVVGGESKRWARDREKVGLPPTETAQPGAEPDVVRRSSSTP